MQKSFQLAALAGALSMSLGSISFAANPDLTFSGWDVTGGTIDHTGAGVTGTNAVCRAGSGYTCAVVADGAGFKQISVAPDAGGDSYIMTIVTDQNASGTPGDGSLGFYDVSFVKMQISTGGSGATNNVNGIQAQQSISESTANTSFESTTDINTGWAQTGSTPVTITQTLVDNGDTTIAGDNFSSGFNYASSVNNVETDPNFGKRDGFTMSIDQVAGLYSATSAGSENDVQTFALRERQGTLLTTDSTTGVTLAGANGGTTTWVAGQDIKAIWLGQSVDLGTDSTSFGTTFGYLSFDNKDDAAAGISEFGFSAVNSDKAWEWDPAFNIDAGSGSPCLADPTGATCPP